MRCVRSVRLPHTHLPHHNCHSTRIILCPRWLSCNTNNHHGNLNTDHDPIIPRRFISPLTRVPRAFIRKTKRGRDTRLSPFNEARLIGSLEEEPLTPIEGSARVAFPCGRLVRVVQGDHSICNQSHYSCPRT